MAIRVVKAYHAAEGDCLCVYCHSRELRADDFALWSEGAQAAECILWVLVFAQVLDFGSVLQIYLATDPQDQQQQHTCHLHGDCALLGSHDL